MKRNLLTVIFIFSLQVAFPANRYWVGTLLVNNWNNTANWSNVNGGPGGFSVPGPADNVFFTGAGNVDCNIDAAVNVRQFATLLSYTQTITQNNNAIVIGAGNTQFNGGNFAGGAAPFTTPTFVVGGVANFTLGSGDFTTTSTFTLNTGSFFTGGTGKITITGNCTINDGVFTSTSDSLFLSGNFAVTPVSPTVINFVHNNGTVVFNGPTNRSYNIAAASSGGVDFWNVVLSMNLNTPNTLTFASDDYMNVNNNLHLNTGTLAGTGSSCFIQEFGKDVSVGSNFRGSNIPLYFYGSGTCVFSLDARYAARSGATVNIFMDTPGDVVQFKSLTPGGTIADGFPNSTFLNILTGTVSFPDNNRVNFDYSQVIIGSGGTMISTSDSLFNSGDHSNQSGSFVHNNGTYIFNGGFNQLLEFVPPYRETFYNLVVDKPGANNQVIFNQVDDTVVVENNLTIVAGKLTNDPTFTSGIDLRGNLQANAGMDLIDVGLVFSGSSDQSVIFDPAVTGNWDGDINISKPNTSRVILNSPLLLDAGTSQDITFNQGIIQSSATNLLTMGANTTVLNANNNSYVTGPLQKIGSNFFEFPLGADNLYAGIRVTGDIGFNSDLASSNTFTAEYFRVNPNPLYPVTSKDPTLDNVSQCEYWILNRDAGTADAYVWPSYDNGRSCGVTDANLLRVAHWDGSTWKDEGNGDISTTPFIRSAGLVTSFSPFTLSSTDAVVNSLPIVLTEFTGKEKGGNVELKWTTSQEINNKYFDIERSADGVHFVSIGKVNGAGNSALVRKYNFLDQHPVNGQNYYRLKQVDFDGTSVYSQVVTVKINRTDVSLKIYPNPAVNYIVAEYSAFANARVNVQLIDNFGRTVINKVAQPGIDGRITLQLPEQVKTAGTYWLKLTSEKETIQEKIMIARP